MHASFKALFVGLSLASACAAPRSEPVVASALPSVRPALERVLDVVAGPAAEASGRQLVRIEAQGDQEGADVVLDLDLHGPDDVALALGLEKLLDTLRGLDGARRVEVRSSRAEGIGHLRLSGLHLEFEPDAAPRTATGERGAHLMTSLRTLAADPDVRLGAVDIEARDGEDRVRISAHGPGGGEGLDRLRRFQAELESRLADARVVGVVLKPVWQPASEPAPTPARYHWRIDVERGT